MRWLRTDQARRERVEDVTLAAVFFGIAQLDVWVLGTVAGPRWLNALILACVAPPLAGRRRWPCGALVVTCVALVVQVVVVPGKPPSGALSAGPVLIGAYSVGAYAASSRRMVGALAVLVVSFDVVFAAAQGLSGSFSTATGELSWCLLPLALWGVGRVVRHRRIAAAATADRVQWLFDRDAMTREALEHERARMARELHDVLAHSVSLMGVQAGAAEQVLGRDPERTRPVLRSIQQTSRESVAELRRLLGMLRADDDALELQPQPGLEQLGVLVARMRDAGLPVSFRTEGSVRLLAPGVELAGYRVVQEALTNALKHAQPSRVDVVVRFSATQLQICVANDGVHPRNGDGTGHGLIGMRERVGLYGGTFDAGPQPDGGFRVDAAIPLESAP
jgi:signal transduction histidine kinase